MTDALLNPWMAGAFIGFAIVAALTVQWLITTIATFRAIAWVPAVSRRLSMWVSAHHYTSGAFFAADGLPASAANVRSTTASP